MQPSAVDRVNISCIVDRGIYFLIKRSVLDPCENERLDK